MFKRSKCGFLLILFCVACSVESPSSEPTLGAENTLSRVSYTSLQNTLSRHVDGRIAVAQANPRSWLAQEQVAQAFLGQARLTGHYSDYGHAQAALEKAFSIDGCAAYKTRAMLNLTLHRVDEAQKDILILDGHKKVNSHSIAALEGLKGEVAFQQGRYEEAGLHYQKSFDSRPLPRSMARMAVYQWKMGDYSGAELAFTEAESLSHQKEGLFLAWINLQRGLMDLDQGRYNDALVHYQMADRKLPHWWLVEEHIAEIHTLTGRLPEAESAYRRLIQSTGNPEFMDALAEVLVDGEPSREREKEADSLIRQAETTYDERLKTFPEATLGHALDHFLRFGEDHDRAIVMAQKNVNLRPGSEAYVLLAKAHLKGGDAAAAGEAIQVALDRPWMNADLCDTAADVFERLGQGNKATAYREMARRINPKGP